MIRASERLKTECGFRKKGGGRGRGRAPVEKEEKETQDTQAIQHTWAAGGGAKNEQNQYSDKS